MITMRIYRPAITEGDPPVTRPKPLTLAQTLAIFPGVPGPEAVALVYAPGWCGFARLADGTLIRPDRPIPTDTYEVRVFNANAELRWRKDPAGDGSAGAAAILGGALLDAPAGWEDVSREDVIEDNHTTYLLWGQVTSTQPAPGWGDVAEARVGAIPVPDPKREFSPKGRVLLHAVEYIAADKFGSAFVCEERLTELKVEYDQG